jgi:hypothetical protein
MPGTVRVPKTADQNLAGCRGTHLASFDAKGFAESAANRSREPRNG